MQNNVLDYLNEIVKRKPDKIAFANDEVQLSFSQVYEQSRSIGAFIAAKGIYKKPVVIFMNKSPKEIVAFFGVITSGCFYVPIDEEMPESRIELILDNVQTDLIICDEETKPLAEKFNFDGKIATYDELAATNVSEEGEAKLAEIHA